MMNIIGHLLGCHFLSTAKRRHLIGDFNSHLENLLLLVANEAFWHGDHQVEGILKDLVTGQTHVIERKGQEPYEVANLLRLVVMGNEHVLIPASSDERRWAAFLVTLKRLKPLTSEARSFFREMRLGMEAGGYRLLLRFLMDYDLSGVDVDAAPDTELLHEQKIEGLDPFHQWWRESLANGRLELSDFGGEEWQTKVPKDAVRDAYRRYRRERNINGREPQETAIGKLLRACAPSAYSSKDRQGERRVNVYRLPDLETAKAEWEAFIGHEGGWACTD